jgi:7-cyano-7-deazaguanine reductase
VIDKSNEQSLAESPLGDHTRYVNQYDASLLYPIDRAQNWQNKAVDRSKLPFMQGSCVDIWNGYEISWLNTQGKPIVRVAQFYISAHSKFIIESKSFKLYLNSFNLTHFDSQEDVVSRMQTDLAAVCQGDVEVKFYHLDEVAGIAKLPGECIDESEITVKDYSPNPQLLKADNYQLTEAALYSHLLKSNCPVTGQPDWASVSIEYKGPKIDEQSLLAYLISYREHGDFHEQCVETIFMDIWQHCQPEQLSVYARYVRRGGLDINPYRSSLQISPANLRLSRQ